MGLRRYLDDLTVTGATKEEHQKNLQRLLAAKTDGLTFNEFTRVSSFVRRVAA